MPKILSSSSPAAAAAWSSFVFAAFALFVASEAAWAAPNPKPKPTPAVSSCPEMITACGCVIDKAKIYVAVNDLTATQSKQICIEIAARNAILNLKNHNVLGKDDGTGIGILIRRGADHVIVEGGDIGGAPAAPAAAAPTPQAKVNLWNIGLVDNADNAIIALFSDFGGSLLQGNAPEPKGNATAGIVLSGARNTFVGAFNANFNGKFGVLIDHSDDATVANFTATRNKDTGVRLVSSNNVSMGPGAAPFNDKFGFWLSSSSHNIIHDSNGNIKNGDTGILLSCAEDKPCPQGGGSNDNRITNAGAPDNGLKGIEIDEGCRDNVVTVTHNQANGGKDDMIDLNPDCDGNTWYNNVGRGNQGCIQ